MSMSQGKLDFLKKRSFGEEILSEVTTVCSIPGTTRKAAQPCCARPVLYRLIRLYETLFDKWKKNVLRLIIFFRTWPMRHQRLLALSFSSSCLFAPTSLPICCPFLRKNIGVARMSHDELKSWRSITNRIRLWLQVGDKSSSQVLTVKF